MSATRSRRAAGVLGAASGARTFAGPGALALRGRPARNWLRFGVLLLTGAEAVADKLPMAKPRSELVPLVGRVVAGAACGAAVGNARGARIGAAFALAATYPTERLRAFAVDRTGLPDPVCAAVEDSVAYGAAWLASASADGDEEAEPDAEEGRRPGPFRAAATGFAAALIGTAAMTSAQAVHRRLTDSHASEAPREVGEKILGLFGHSVDRSRRPALNTAMHVIYGSSWGVPYGVLAARRPGPASGLALGAAVWSASLAELPALSVAPLPWEQSLTELATDLGFHLVYGFATGAAYEALA